MERSLTHKLEDARDYLYQRLVEILIAYKSSMTAGGAGASAQLAVSENMKMLPVLIPWVAEECECCSVADESLNDDVTH